MLSDFMTETEQNISLFGFVFLIVIILLIMMGTVNMFLLNLLAILFVATQVCPTLIAWRRRSDFNKAVEEGLKGD